MISPKIKLKGAKVFINKLNRDMDTLQNKINDMVKLEGENLYSRSQRDVAVFSGDLKKSGKNLNIYNGKVLTSSVEYGNDMDIKYGAYKEFGTGIVTGKQIGRAHV